MKKDRWKDSAQLVEYAYLTDDGMVCWRCAGTDKKQITTDTLSHCLNECAVCECEIHAANCDHGVARQ